MASETSPAVGNLTVDLEALSREELIELLEAQLEGGIRITFAGKANARSLARRVRPRVSRPVTKYGAGTAEQRAENLLIEGDNLQAMATLYRYRGQVDLVIADPPYNTGKDFRYNDKWEDDPNDSGLGDFISEDDPARHTKWMRFMWPRLQMMKSMLKPGGVLAICIDQRELFRLGQMLDELFREQNRIAIINWQRSYTRANDSANVATTTEYVLVYARDLDRAKTGLLPRAEASSDGSMPDHDPRDWTDGPATGSNAKAHKSMVYGIQSPFTGEIFYPPVGSAWRAGQEQNLEWLRGWGCKYVLRDLGDEDERARIIGVPKAEVPAGVKGIALGESLKTAAKKARALQESGPWPMFYFLKGGEGRPRLKKYVEDLKPGYVPTTFWATDDFSLPAELGDVSWPHQVSGHSEQGVDELTAIVGEGHEFKTVKPLKLFERIIQLWTPNDGLVIDPFAGSGTAGQAVLALNAADDASARRFILIEQGRPERGDSYARTLTSKRLQGAVTGKWANGKGLPLGGGFEFQTLEKKVDAEALLHLERDEMVDTIIGSYFAADDRKGPSLLRVTERGARYLVAKNRNNEGVFLVWNGSTGNTNLTREVYQACVREAKAAELEPVYHVYARLFVYQTKSVVFYQIPDRILADFGLDLKSEPFGEDADD